jgi:hypothetical protein
MENVLMNKYFAQQRLLNGLGTEVSRFMKKGHHIPHAKNNKDFTKSTKTQNSPFVYVHVIILGSIIFMQLRLWMYLLMELRPKS